MRFHPLPAASVLVGRAKLPLALLSAALIFSPIAVRGQHPNQANPRHQPASSSLNERDAHGLTPLVAAAAAGQAGAVSVLISQGAQVDASAADGRTPLIAAVQSGHTDIVKALIAAGADLNGATRFTGTALELAERQGNQEIAALLLESGARSSGESVGDTVCVRPWSGEGFCGTVKSFTVRSVLIHVTRIVGCANGCEAREECSAARPVGGPGGLQTGEPVAVPSWCLTQTGVKP